MKPGRPLRLNDADRRAAPGDDLAWAAFRYVADAMNPVEAAAFEQTLSNDQWAREAVAAAVDRFGALDLVCHEITASPPVVVIIPARRFSVSQAGLQGLAAAAAVVWFVAWWGSDPRPDLVSGDQAVEVARAWSNLRRDPTPPEGTLPFQPDSGGGVGDLTLLDSAPTEVAELPADQSLPSWMMAAVAAEPDPANPAPEDN